MYMYTILCVATMKMLFQHDNVTVGMLGHHLQSFHCVLHVCMRLLMCDYTLAMQNSRLQIVMESKVTLSMIII